MDRRRAGGRRGGTALTRPEDALERARVEAERKRAAGLHDPRRPGALEPTISAEVPTLDDLESWAAIAVDPQGAYSTRRLGAPITALKRGLLRLLRQYTRELEAQQTRFNVAVVERLRELERRRGE